VSELLRSQLLQPLHLAPIPPRLAESNLYLIGRGGPGAFSFNEFSPLFNRDQQTVQLTAIAAEQSTFGLEPIVAGMHRKLSFSVGYTHFETGGVRTNTDYRDDIVNAFAQLEPTSRASIQAEYRHRDGHRGDLQPYFAEAPRTSWSETDRTDTARLGARYAFSPGSIVLASVVYQRADFAVTDPRMFRFEQDRHAVAAEVQHLLRTRFVDVVTGAGYSSDDVHEQFTIDGGPEFSSDGGAHHANAYAYVPVHLRRDLTLTLGASWDALRVDDGADSLRADADQVSPKVGLTWEPLRGTRIRAAALRSFRRPLVADQSVEPTQVAGFNQLFEDPEGTSAWRYGVGVDQQLARDLFVGAEGTQRDLRVPIVVFSSPPDVTSHETMSWKEYLARAYLFWTPHERLALRAEYFFERLLRDDRFAAEVRAVDTHRAPLGAVLFLTAGLSVSATATYYDQTGRFGFWPDAAPGHDHFWVIDAALSWRLPRRHGFFTVGATNLLDEGFRLYETRTSQLRENTVRVTNVGVQPDRAVFARVTLVAP
jgi:outer membrane receptor protein involved in Fe transport